MRALRLILSGILMVVIGTTAKADFPLVVKQAISLSSGLPLKDVAHWFDEELGLAFARRDTVIFRRHLGDEPELCVLDSMGYVWVRDMRLIRLAAQPDEPCAAVVYFDQSQVNLLLMNLHTGAVLADVVLGNDDSNSCHGWGSCIFTSVTDFVIWPPLPAMSSQLSFVQLTYYDWEVPGNHSSGHWTGMANTYQITENGQLIPDSSRAGTAMKIFETPSGSPNFAVWVQDHYVEIDDDWDTTIHYEWLTSLQPGQPLAPLFPLCADNLPCYLNRIGAQQDANGQHRIITGNGWAFNADTYSVLWSNAFATDNSEDIFCLPFAGSTDERIVFMDYPSRRLRIYDASNGSLIISSDSIPSMKLLDVLKRQGHEPELLFVSNDRDSLFVVRPIVPPVQDLTLHYFPATGTCRLRWHAAPQALHYLVQSASTPEGVWNTLFTLNADQTTASVPLPQQSPLFFRVIAEYAE